MLKGTPPHFFRPLAAQKNGGEEGNLIWHSDSVRRTFSPPSRTKVFFLGGRGRKVLLLFSGYKKDKSLILLPGNMSLLKTREHTQSIGIAKKSGGLEVPPPGVREGKQGSTRGRNANAFGAAGEGKSLGPSTTQALTDPHILRGRKEGAKSEGKIQLPWETKQPRRESLKARLPLLSGFFLPPKFFNLLKGVRSMEG